MAEAIIERILTDAAVIAKSTLEEGQAKADELLETAENDARIYKERQDSENDALREQIVSRRKSVAHLEAKKKLLEYKKAAVDKSFVRALEKISALPKEEYLSIIRGMLKAAEDGDLVYIAEKDHRVITKTLVEATAKARGIKLKLADQYAPINGGIILSSGDVEKNLSAEVELNALRDEYEAELAVKMFGERE